MLQRSAAVDSETAPTMFLPVLANKASPRGALPPRSASSASSADTASAAVVVEERSVADSAVSEPVGSSKRDSSSNRPKPSKPIVHPPWVDDVKVVEPLAGRGKGKAQELKEPKDKDPGEPSEPSRSKMGSKSSSKAQSIGDVTAPTSVLTVPVIALRERTSPPRDRVVYPVPSTDMTQGEKLTVQLISKARERVMTAEEAKKPLSNTEKALLKRCVRVLFSTKY